MCHRVCVFACVFSFQKRGQVCSTGLAHLVFVRACVCVGGWVCTGPTHMYLPTHTVCA